MNNKLGALVGLLVLLAGGASIYVLFRQGPPVVEEVEETPQTVVPVEVTQMRRMMMYDYVRAYGSITPDPGTGASSPASVSISSPADGLITEVNCAVGQEVHQGRVLFSLYDQPARLAVEQASQAVRFAEEMRVVTVGAYGLPGKTKIRVMGP